MVKEALRAHDEKKGASVVAIKRFILAKYPSVDPIRLKYLLKQALSKGLSCGELVRPHNSSAVGATGTFKVSQGCCSHRAGSGLLPGPADSPLTSSWHRRNRGTSWARQTLTEDSPESQDRKGPPRPLWQEHNSQVKGCW